MLRVNEIQLATLEAHFAEEFVGHMTRTLFLSFPAQCQARGRESITTFVRESITRARGKTIGTNLEVDFRRYVVTEFVLGVEPTAKIAAEERKRLEARDGRVDPSILVFLIYQAMLGQVMPKSPPPPPQTEYEVCA